MPGVGLVALLRRNAVAWLQRLFVAGCVMIAKSFVMLVLATMAGPAIGLGLFILLHNF